MDLKKNIMPITSNCCSCQPAFCRRTIADARKKAGWHASNLFSLSHRCPFLLAHVEIPVEDLSASSSPWKLKKSIRTIIQQSMGIPLV